MVVPRFRLNLCCGGFGENPPWLAAGFEVPAAGSIGVIRRPQLQIVRNQHDLTLLPEPRFFYTASTKVRWFAAALMSFGAMIGLGIMFQGIAEGGKLFPTLAGAILFAICAGVLFLARPTDWRSWISLAATPDGLYVVAGPRNVIFVPWNDVVEIGAKELATIHIGDVSYPRLRLRLPEEVWAKFGKLSSISGTGPVRDYLLSAFFSRGEVLVEQLEAFRSKHC